MAGKVGRNSLPVNGDTQRGLIWRSADSARSRRATSLGQVICPPPCAPSHCRGYGWRGRHKGRHKGWHKGWHKEWLERMAGKNGWKEWLESNSLLVKNVSCSTTIVFRYFSPVPYRRNFWSLNDILFRRYWVSEVQQILYGCTIVI